MLRMYFVQHWFHLADEACEDVLLDSTSICRFMGIDLRRERVPDAITLLKSRRLLQKHKLGEVLQTNGLKVGTGGSWMPRYALQLELNRSKASDAMDCTNQKVR